MSGTAFSSTVTQVDLGTTASPQRFPLGYKVTLPATKAGANGVDNNSGEQVWVYIYNDHGSAAFAAGNVIVRDVSAATTDASISGSPFKLYGGTRATAATVHPAVSVLGVAQHAIASGSFGFIQCKGQCLVLNGTADITQDAALTTGGDGAGSAIDFADGAEEGVFGFAMETEASNATTFDAYINCPGA